MRHWALGAEEKREVKHGDGNADGHERRLERAGVGVAAHDGGRAREPDLDEDRDGQLQREKRLAPDQAAEGVLHRKARRYGAHEGRGHADGRVAVVDVVFLAEHAGADGAGGHACRDA